MEIFQYFRNISTDGFVVVKKLLITFTLVSEDMVSCLLSCRVKKVIQPSMSYSAPPGPITSLQTVASAKERPVRRRKDKQDGDQLIIVCFI